MSGILLSRPSYILDKIGTDSFLTWIQDLRRTFPHHLIYIEGHLETFQTVRDYVHGVLLRQIILEPSGKIGVRMGKSRANLQQMLSLLDSEINTREHFPVLLAEHVPWENFYLENIAYLLRFSRVH